MAMIPAFFDRNMPRNFGFYDRKMNWTFLLIFSSSSLNKGTKFSSSSFSKKVNWVQFKVHQKSELLNWTELFRSVQSLPWLLHIPLQHTHIPLAKGLLENPRRTYNVVGSTGHHLYIALFLQECLRVRLAQFLPQNEDTFSTFLYFCHNEKNKMLHTYV